MQVIIRNKKQYEQRLKELEDLREAKKKALAAQSYTIGSRQMNHASLRQISEEIQAYEQAIDAYETNGSTKRRTRRVVPLG